MPGLEELHRHLDGVTYPATRDGLVAHAAKRGASEEVLDRLRNIEDEEYDSPQAVSAAFTYEGDTSMEYGHVTVHDQ